MMTNLEVQYLQAMADRNGGRLAAESVVDAARDPDNPLHDRFQWDDAEAAHQHRLSQARALIRSVRIEVVTTTHTLVAPAYLRDPEAGPKEQGYVSISSLRSREDAAREAIVTEFRRAASALRRARAVAEGLSMADQVETLLTGVESLVPLVQKPAE